MKKIMIALAVAAVAAVSQAATVSWQASGFAALPADATCTKSASSLGKGDVKMFVWEFAAADWNTSYESAENIWAAVQDGTLSLSSGVFSKAGTATAQPKVTGGTSWSEGDSVYAAILFLHDDGKGFTVDSSDYYMGNYAVAEATDAGNAVQKLGTLIGGASGTSATSWTSTAAIPEPTSGLLLLLGMAGLALRRRRA